MKKKFMSAQGFEPWKHYALELEPSSFDHSEILTKKIFPLPGFEPGSHSVKGWHHKPLDHRGWCSMTGLNRRPPRYKHVALPTELMELIQVSIKIIRESDFF